MLRRISIVFAIATLALPTTAEAQADIDSGLTQALSNLTGGLGNLGSQIQSVYNQIESNNNLTSEQQKVCTSNPIGVQTVALAEFVIAQELTGFPPPGNPLTEQQCSILGFTLNAVEAAAEDAFALAEEQYKEDEQAISEILQALNSVFGSLAKDLSVQVSGNPNQEQNEARATAARALVVSAGGPSLTTVRIYFDRRRVAHAASTRAKARIAWRRAKPGLHHIRAVATHTSGAKLERHLWLLRRNDRIIRLLRRTK